VSETTTLYNQTKSELRFTIGMQGFQCEPWGSLEMPSMFVVHCEKRGLPLGRTPVAPELRAHQRLQDEQESARSDDLVQLRKLLENAKAQAKTNAEQLADEQAAKGDALRRIAELETALAKSQADLKASLADKKAAEDLLAETARNATNSEERALRAEAKLEAAQKPAKPKAAPEQSARQ
jgi:hypothetical protein